MKKSLMIGLAMAAVTATASHVEQTLTFKAGWNAVYLEVTPDDGNEATTDDASCEKVFGGDEAVTTVMVYDSDAYETTRQYADDGSEILQKPVSYLTWLRGDTTGSTFHTLVGGRCYLIYVAGDSKTSIAKTITGVPRAPAMTWRDTTKGDFVNLVGFMLSSDNVLASKCFSEGPYGSKGTIYKVSGTGDVPDFKAVAFMGAPKVSSGLAYGASAERPGSWGGVIGFVGSDKVVFGPDESQASIEVKNAGAIEHTFRFSVVRSTIGENFPEGLARQLPRTDIMVDRAWTNVIDGTAWEVKLAPGKSVVDTFFLNRLKMKDAYGAVLVIEDLSGTQMRVRVPIIAEKVSASETAGAVQFPVGLWCGYIQMETVSRIDDADQIPVKAGDTLKMNVMMHVAPNGEVKLLQRVAAGIDTNGTPRLWRELESVPATVANARRFSTVMMSIDTPVVEKTSGTFGESLAFDWTVAENAADNPFRHAWHPDHDGKKTDFKSPAPSGDDPANYAGTVKPELWSIVNRMEFSWHENNDPYATVNFEQTPTEKTAGFVTWTVSGLTAKEPIRSLGVFVLQRAIKAGTIED
ncbi:MAG: hypothetical protein IJ658_00690 [Kiritimatiellae bacterium]|nr:hypothetical protein [Kiritimatiellia bacterium]